MIVSAGGATDMPCNYMTGAAYGAGVARWAVENHMDGMDFDMESFEADATINWLVDASLEARAILCPARLLTHAPRPPTSVTSAQTRPTPGRSTRGATQPCGRVRGPP